jgi:acyl carrier protein
MRIAREAGMNDSLSIKVREVIAGHFGISRDRLTDESRLRDDLGADRLDRLELVIAIEDRMAGLKIDDVLVDQFETIGDLVRVIKRVHNGRAAAPGTGAKQDEG